MRGSVALFLAILTFVSAFSSIPLALSERAVNLAVTNVFWGTNPLYPLTAHPGDKNVYLSIVLTNVGDAIAWDVNGTLILKYPFSFTYVSDGEIHPAYNITASAGMLMPGQSFALRYTLDIDPNAREGLHRLELKLSYKTQADITITTAMFVDVPVWGGELHVQRVLTIPLKVHPGDKNVNVKVWIVNTGTATAKDVDVELQLRHPFKPSSSGSNKMFVGNVQPGLTSEANFYIDVDESAACGDYSLALLMKYGFSGAGLVTSVSIFISEKAFFEILKIEPSEVYADTSGTVVRVTVKNVSNVTAESLRAQLKVGNFFSGTIVDYLGDVHPQENKTAAFALNIDGRAAPGLYRFDLRLDWTQDEKALSQTSAIALKVSQKPFPTFYVVASIAIAILTIIALGILKKKGKVDVMKLIKKKPR